MRCVMVGSSRPSRTLAIALVTLVATGLRAADGDAYAAADARRPRCRPPHHSQRSLRPQLSATPTPTPWPSGVPHPVVLTLDDARREVLAGRCPANEAQSGAGDVCDGDVSGDLPALGAPRYCGCAVRPRSWGDPIVHCTETVYGSTTRTPQGRDPRLDPNQCSSSLDASQRGIDFCWWSDPERCDDEIPDICTPSHHDRAPASCRCSTPQPGATSARTSSPMPGCPLGGRPCQASEPRSSRWVPTRRLL